MKNLYLIALLLIFFCASAQAQAPVKGAAILYYDSIPSVPSPLPTNTSGAEIAYSIKLKKLYKLNRTTPAWEEIKAGIDTFYRSNDTLYIEQGAQTFFVVLALDYVPTTDFTDSLAVIRDTLTDLRSAITSLETNTVPPSRTLTINSTTYDLSTDRTWNVGDLLSSGSYANPSWITSLVWSKITSTPTTLSGYGITDAISKTLTSAQILVGNGSNVATAVSLSGDATISNTGALTLANTAVSAGSYGSATQVPTYTVDAKGRLTAASNTSITGLLSGLTANRIPVASSATALINGYLLQDATGVTLDASKYFKQTGGATVSRPSGSEGMEWFNTTQSEKQIYAGGAWKDILTGNFTPTYLAYGAATGGGLTESSSLYLSGTTLVTPNIQSFQAGFYRASANEVKIGVDYDNSWHFVRANTNLARVDGANSFDLGLYARTGFETGNVFLSQQVATSTTSSKSSPILFLTSYRREGGVNKSESYGWQTVRSSYVAADNYFALKYRIWNDTAITDATLFRVTPAGLFGFGNITPTQPVDINGNTRLRAHLYDYNNSNGSAGQFLKRGASGVEWATTTLFTQTASATVANTTTATTLTSTGTGTLTIPANTLVAGKTYTIRASGYWSTTATNTITLFTKLGSVAMGSTDGITVSNTGASPNSWEMEYEFTVRTTGASGTGIGQGSVHIDGQYKYMLNTSTFAIDTTSALLMDMIAQWNAASSGDTITLTNLSISVKN